MLKQYKGYFFVILSAVLFGSMPLVAKIFYTNGGNPITLTLLRNILALPVLWLLMRRSGGDCRINRLRLSKIAMLALGFAATPLLLYSSYNYISTGMAMTIHFVYPAFVLLGCVLFCREPFDWIKALCAVLCTAGILLFYSPEHEGSLTGIVLAFVSGITYAFYIIYLDWSGLSALAPFSLLFWLALVSAGEILVFSLAAGSLSLSLTSLGWLLSLVFSLGTTVAAVALFQAGVQAVGPQRAAILSTFEPITSIVVGIAVFSEPFGLRTGVGVLLILAGVLLLTLFDREKTQTPG
jgi:drug/metabolite transporter (DMT)-like permease